MSLRGLIFAWLLALTACATAPAQIAADSAVNAPRLIALDGAQNFRDIGGYRTADGHRVKWGVIYRSAALSALTEEDLATLGRLDVRRVYDFRSSSERTQSPTTWRGAGAPNVTTLDYELDSSGISAAMRGGADPAALHAAFAASYPTMLRTLTPEYRELFEGLIAGEGGTLYHCTAGKDRTGIATALILTALNVPRETIYTDYLMSNRYYRPTGGPMASLPENVRAILIGVDESYLRTAFTAIESEYGSVEAYLDRELGVDAADIARLRALYTE